ncbi:Putative ribonuclease H protein [Dendrobium catenatum]|uniref:Ribonuclease H protein n=1 Tax=Dendrobium catenatum TaxID=906689 RepID=A0A2I0WZ05_9ASPA|nr:Putative ribonuclease H protein [Dendrobium catenatum]
MQSDILIDLQTSPLSADLNYKLKLVNAKLAYLHSSWTSCISQRAKAYWLTKGEDDLGYLYSKIKSRNNKNIIREITSVSGTFSSHSSISESIISHFNSLFNAPIAAVVEDYNIPVGKVIPSQLISLLTAPFLDEDIKKIVFSRKSIVAPDPDGFTFEFYKKTWHLRGPKMCRAIKIFFTTGFLPRATKATAIALIPKGLHASHITDYRPISLCNVFYKVIAKLLANRMKIVLPHIIHENQVGFISKGNASDNIILAAELLREFKAGSNLFCAKLDVKKAFDSLSREFLFQRLKLKGFPDIFINWIKGCITDVYFSICVNGSLEGFFNSSSGLRQGCPLSPLLFCIAMDGLSSSLHSPHFSGLSFNGVDINHLMYADDLLVFGKSEVVNVNFLKNALYEFGRASNLHINPSKSSILFAKDTSSANDIAEILGIENLNTYLIYLGLPISPKRLNASHFQPLLDKVTALLAGWKVKFLSFAGRLQFLKFSISSTLAYWIRGSIIPKGCRSLITKLCSKFMLHGNIEDRKLHLIAWHNISKPKSCGGLGILSFDAFYYAVICSFIWRWFNNPSLAISWLKAKYESPFKSSSISASKFWKGICDVASKIKTDITFSVGGNCNFSFNWDPWMDGLSLGDIAYDARLNFKMVDGFILNGVWALPDFLSPQLSAVVLNVPIQEHSGITWAGSVNPTFKSFCNLFYSTLEEVDWHRFIWHKKSSLKFASYAWMTITHKLKCADVLIKRGMIVSAACSFCANMTENHNHIFFSVISLSLFF